MLVTTSACTSSGTVCTLVGPPPPGVTFDVGTLLPLSAPGVLELCAGEVCREVTVAAGERLGGVALSVDPGVEREATVPVTLALRQGDRVVRRAAGSTRVRLTQPNGPQCDPEQWSGTAVLRGDRLVPR